MFNLSLQELLQHLINGLTLGAIYALIALGYTMVYGILKFINFAHGEILMVGTFISLAVYNVLCSTATSGMMIIVFFIISIIIAMISSGLLGVVIEKIAYKPLRNASRLAPLLSAIGVSIILTNLAQIIFGTKDQRFAYPYNNDPFNLFGISITPTHILTIIVSLFLMVILKFFIDKTKLGKAMRATSENKRIAALMGINVDFIVSLTFAIGSSLAAVAGILYALDYKAKSTMGLLIGLKAFIAAVIGGIGNITGAMLGGLLLGLLETIGFRLFEILVVSIYSIFGKSITGIPLGLKHMVAFSMLILILLIKPSGILGKNVREKV